MCRHLPWVCVALEVCSQQCYHCMESSGPLSWGEQSGKLLTLQFSCIKIMQIILCLCVICGISPGTQVCNPEKNKQCLSRVCWEWLIAHWVANLLLGQHSQKISSEVWLFGGHLCTRNKHIGAQLKSWEFVFLLTENSVFVHHVENWAKIFPRWDLPPRPCVPQLSAVEAITLPDWEVLGHLPGTGPP